jgi:hypothetical protein
MHFWAKHAHLQTELLSDSFDVLETFLVVGASTTDPDLDLVLVEERGDFTQGADDTLECGGDL